MLGIPRDAECGEEGDEEQRREHWRSWQMVRKVGQKRKNREGEEGKGRKGTGKASEKAATELRKEVCQKGLDALSKAHSFLGFAPAA